MADAQKNILINIDLETGNVNSQLEQIDNKIGSLGNNVNVQSFKSIRSEIREAREEAVRLAIAIEDAEASGENIDRLSQRYTEVTNRAAQLSDAVEDVNNSISNANPDNRLQGLVSIAQGAATAVQGVAGAFTLLGVDAETAQVAIAKLQGLIALTDAISSIDTIKRGYKDLSTFINASAVAQRANNVATAAAVAVQRLFTSSVLATGTAFKALRVAIAATGIGLLVVAIGTVVSALSEWISGSKKAEEQANREKEAIERLTQAYEDESREIDANNKKRLLQLRLQGASEAKIRQEQYNQALQARDRALKAELDLERQAGVTQEQLRSARQARIDAQNNLEIQSLQNQIDAAEENRDRLKSIEESKTSTVKSNVDERKNKEKEAAREVNEFLEEQRTIDRQRRQTDLQNTIDEINKRFERAIQLQRAYGKSTVELEKLRQTQIAQATQQAQQQGQAFLNEQQLELLAKRVKRIGEEIAKDLAGIESNEALKQAFANRIEEIQAIFTLGARLREQQIQAEKKARLEQFEALKGGLSASEQETLRQTIEEDARIALQVITDELANQEESLIKGFRITGLEFDIAKANEQVSQIETLLDRIIQPFRKAEAKSGIANFFRKFTTIDKAEEEKIRKEAFDTYTNLALGFIEKEAELRATTLESIGRLQKQLIDETSKIDAEELAAQARGITNLQSFADRRIELEKKTNAEIAKLNFELAAQVNIAERETLTLAAKKLSESELAVKQSTLRIFTITKDLNQFQDSFTRNFLTGERFRTAFDELLQGVNDYYDALRAKQIAEFNKEKSNRLLKNEEIQAIELENSRRLKAIEDQRFADVEAINLATLNAKLELYNNIGAGIGALGRLFEQGTAAQKTAALAELAINTATGFANGLAIAQQTAKAAGPGAAFAFPIFYAAQIAAVLNAIGKAKQILSTVKGGGSTSSSAAATAPTTAPAAISSTLFNLPPEAQNVRVVNQQSQVVRAFITQEDLRSAQEKQNFLNKLSSF